MSQTLVKVKQETEADQLKRAFVKVMVEVAQKIPQTLTLTDVKQVSSAIPHLAEVATNFNILLTDEDLIWPSTGIARFYEGQANYQEALVWFQHCLEILESRLGNDHINVATSLSNLARIYRLQGEYNKAEPLLNRAQKLTQLGENHLFTGTCYNDLGLLYGCDL